MKDPIFVTKPYLPAQQEFQPFLDRIWNAQILTNNGPLVRELEQKLEVLLGVKHLLFVSNGTIAIQLAIQALGIRKEIITTPYTYVASLSSILWEHCTPVFADIDKYSTCIDPSKIEERITANTEAILAVHVYGIPCDVHAIERIAKKHNLKVIYDAAHAFGTRLKNQSILNFGDISTLSFHATKLFHTVEGGAVITNDDTLFDKLSLLRSFGYKNDDYTVAGINAKNSELHAAMGLCNIPHVNEIIQKRTELSDTYDRALSSLFERKLLVKPVRQDGTEYNFSYYPVFFTDEQAMIDTTKALENLNVYPRRYFYPSLNTLPYITYTQCPISEDISSRVLCLPLYHDLNTDGVEYIASCIRTVLIQPSI